MRMSFVAPLLGAVMLAGCAQIPDVTVNYYLPKVSLQATVTQTIGCVGKNENNVDSRRIIALTAFSTTASHSRDERASYPISLGKLDGGLANSDLGFTFHEDGRLKGLNTTQTGQAGEIVKSALTLASAIGINNVRQTGDSDVGDACAFLEQVSKDKLITVTQSHDAAFTTSTSLARFQISPQNQAYYAKIMNVIGKFCFESSESKEQITPRVVPNPGVGYNKGDQNRSDVVMLSLAHPKMLDLRITQGTSETCGSGTWAKVWEGKIAAPQLGTPFELPLPKAPAFGKQTVVLELAESGMITSLKFGKESGMPGATNTLSGVIGHFDGDTTSEKAAKLKAEADLIKEQQRLIRCQTNPPACT